MGILGTIKNEGKDIISTITGIDFSKSYVPKANYTGKQIVGFNDTAFNYVDSRYKVVIENNKWIVNAWLQENFEFGVTSEWNDIIGIPSLGGLTQGAVDAVNAGGKALTGTVAKNMAMTRRKWIGSSPLSISLKLRFRAYDDAQKEVVQAVHALQDMALPKEAESMNLQNVSGGRTNIIPGFLIPPGPNEQYANPRNASLKSTEAKGNERINQTLGGAGDVISIDMFAGGFYLDMIVIRSVEATFDPKMTTNGPVAAEVILKIESYEILTKQKLDNAYSGAGYISNSSRGTLVGRNSPLTGG